MFEKAIIESQQYTRPILSVLRSYSNQLLPAAGTMFFVNHTGAAVTCKHVAEVIISGDKLWQKFQAFQAEKALLLKGESFDNELIQLEQKYEFNSNATVQLLTTFQNCFDKITGFKIHSHPNLDLAIIQFEGFSQVLYAKYAQFIADESPLNIGKFLCRVGFPFPEFNNFRINENDNLEWTNSGIMSTPIFPIEGMITRFVQEKNEITHIELSTPGLRGQSGGPLFDTEGVVYGMQSHTMHLHLGFDLKDHLVSNQFGGERISNHPFLHVGRCIHAIQIKKFLHENGVAYFVKK